MSSPGDDPMLDDYLKRDTEVSRRYRELDADGVPPELDRRVLDQAREAASKSRRWVRWSAPIALAASAVLVVSIVLETGVDKDAVGTLPAPASAPTATPTSQPEAARESAESANELDAAAKRSDLARREQAAADEEALEERRSSAPLIAGEANPPVMVVPVQPQPQPVPLEAPSAPAAVAASPAPAPAAAAASAPPPAVLEEQIAPATRGNAQTTQLKRERSVSDSFAEAQEVVVTGARRPTGEVQSSPVAVTADKALIDPNAYQRELEQAQPNPEQWLESIRQLRREGKAADADREWKRFRELFPDYPVAEADAARTPGTR